MAIGPRSSTALPSMEQFAVAHLLAAMQPRVGVHRGTGKGHDKDKRARNKKRRRAIKAQQKRERAR